MVKFLGSTRSPRHPSTTPTDLTPAAVRAVRPGWRDPRLLLGLVVIVVCLVVGGRLMASADDSVEVWSLDSDQAPGAVLTPDDLSPRRVHFEDSVQLHEYYLTSDDLPDRLTLVRGVGKDELLPRRAIGSQAQRSGLVQLPLAVDPEQIPPSVRVGSVIDVYVVVPSALTPLGKPAAPHVEPAIERARVVALGGDGGLASAGGAVQLTVALPQRQVDGFFTRLAAADAPMIVVVAR